MNSKPPEDKVEAGIRRSDFVREIVGRDLETGKHKAIRTRFPPEPNGYLHIGHAKSICLNFGIGLDYGGKCNLRFDDTNPEKEEVEYVQSIIRDVRWLGFDWEDRLYYASDYFDQLHEFAVKLIHSGKAYVCDLSPDEMRDYRGTLTESGRESPWRHRPVQENLELFERMRLGEFEEGARTLRAKIDMLSPNLNLRDPVIYRIKKASHHRTGAKWCVYPMYDYTHCLSDMIEGITHSICTLEFENHRPLYDWVLDTLSTPCHPRQIEFARLNLSYTVLSKRKLLELVGRGFTNGWDDPRMPTLAGIRRRGFTAEAIRDFCERIGVGKRDGVVEIQLLEECQRDYLNKTANRKMAVLRPLRLVLENYPEDREENFDIPNNPEDPAAGVRKVPFSKYLYIEHEDFREDPPKKYHRMAPGREVRLRGAFLVTCTGFTKDEVSGEITEIRCRVDPETRGGTAPDGRSPKATIHWVSQMHALGAEIRLYEHLFAKADPDDYPEGADFTANLNPNSLATLTGCKVEPSLAATEPLDRFQFERQGYFCTDPETRPGRLVFNRTVTLRDSWAKIEAKGKGSGQS